MIKRTVRSLPRSHFSLPLPISHRGCSAPRYAHRQVGGWCNSRPGYDGSSYHLSLDNYPRLIPNGMGKYFILGSVLPKTTHTNDQYEFVCTLWIAALFIDRNSIIAAIPVKQIWQQKLICYGSSEINRLLLPLKSNSGSNTRTTPVSPLAACIITQPSYSPPG